MIDIQTEEQAGLKWAGGSVVGSCRAQNEDAFGITDALFVVADGMRRLFVRSARHVVG